MENSLRLTLCIVLGFAVQSIRGTVNITHPRIIPRTNIIVHNRSLFPYQVSIRSVNNTHFCGGTILDAAHILTAAHCVGHGKTTANQLRIVAGDLNLHAPIDQQTQVRNVSHVFTHHAHDVAILRVAMNFTLNEWTRAVPRLGIDTQLKVAGLVTGWCTNATDHKTTTIGGNRDTPNYRPVVTNELRVSDVTVLSAALCEHTLSDDTYNPEVMLCAVFNYSTMEGECNGDIGGPLVCNNGALCGVVAYRQHCAVMGKPAKYLNVSHFASWIESKTNGANIRKVNMLIIFIIVFVSLRFFHSP